MLGPQHHWNIVWFDSVQELLLQLCVQSHLSNSVRSLDYQPSPEQQSQASNALE